MAAGLIIGTLLLGPSVISRKDRSLILPVLCIVYILLAPLLIGIAHGNNLADVARDIAPIMFMAVLPFAILFLPQDTSALYRLRVLLAAILVIGLVSALQFYNGIVQL